MTTPNRTPPVAGAGALTLSLTLLVLLVMRASPLGCHAPEPTSTVQPEPPALPHTATAQSPHAAASATGSAAILPAAPPVPQFFGGSKAMAAPLFNDPPAGSAPPQAKQQR